MALEPGADFGPYRIVERAGRGGMATVYKAYQAALARNVAIKVLPDYLAEDGAFPERFQREAVALASLRHPNIPAVFDYGTVDGVTFIAAEYIDGGTLTDQLGRALPPEYVVDILRPIASALDYAHARGVLHRDIKPSNIMLARDGRPLLNDFGLAQMMSTEGKLTTAGTIMGTPQYMAPEQCAGEDLTPAADIYSLAVVAYEMLTGRVPFQAATPAAIILAQMRDPLPPPRTINPDLSDSLEATLLKGLAKNPAERFASASAMVSSLATSQVTHAPATAPGARPVEPPPARARRSLRGLAVAAGAGVLLVAAAAGAYLLAHRPAANPASARGASYVNGQVPITVVGTPLPARTDMPPPKGPLAWSANLASPSSFADPVVTPPGSATARFGAKGLELAISRPDGRLTLVSKAPPLQRYLGEIEMQIARGSHLSVNWTIRPGDGQQNGDHLLNIDAGRTSVALEYAPPPGSNDPVSDIYARYTTPQLANGSSFTIDVESTGDEYLLYFDNAQFDDVIHSNNPPAGVMGLGIYGHDGSVRVTGFRLYNLP